MTVVRSAERRKEKFSHKIDAEVLAKQTSLLKPNMVKYQSIYFSDMASLEQRVKALVEGEGVYGIQVRDYLNYSREIYRIAKKFGLPTLQYEAQTRLDKWQTRGLSGALLVRVAQLLGVTPTAKPPTPTIQYLDDLLDVDVPSPNDKEVLTYEASTALWKNKAVEGMVQHGNEWHTLDLITGAEVPSYETDPNINPSPNYLIPFWGRYTRSQAGAAKLVFLQPLWISKTLTVDEAYFWLTVSESGKNMRIGAYADNGATPFGGALLYDSGNISTAGSANEMRGGAISPSIAFTKGIVWVCIATESTIHSFGSDATFPQFPATAKNPMMDGCSFTMSVWGSLPSTCPAVTKNNYCRPWIIWHVE